MKTVIFLNETLPNVTSILKRNIVVDKNIKYTISFYQNNSLNGYRNVIFDTNEEREEAYKKILSGIEININKNLNS